MKSVAKSGAKNEEAGDHRHFSRIGFHAPARLEVGAESWSCEVLDLSLRGALVRPLDGPGALGVPLGSPACLSVPLDDGEIVITMQTRIAHRETDHLGLACEDIDLDSITHLRRLIELNLGDTALLERELGALTSGG